MFTRIELYNNCILTARNTEVFRTKELLEQYLATLDKPYVQDIDLPNVYTRLNGTINLDTTPFNKTFNYIKFTEFDDNNTAKIVCYAFIDSFQIINGLTVIRYTQDIWHTYIGEWSLRESFVKRSNVLRVGEPYRLPLDYINNGELGVKQFNEPISTNDNKFAIIVKIQIFDLQSGGNPSGVLDEQYYIYDFLTYTSTTAYGTKSLDTIVQVNNALDDMQQWQNENKWCFSLSITTKHYARIVETYVVPFAWFNNLSLYEPSNNYRLLYEISSGTYRQFNQFSYTNPRNLLKQWVLDDAIAPIEKEKLFSFGLFTSQIPYKFDGLNKAIYLYLVINRDEFGLYLSYDRQMIDISKEFLMLQDYTPSTPDVLAQREIARKVSTVKGITGMINNVAQIGVGIATLGAGIPSIPFTTAESPLDAFGIPIPQQMMKSPTQAARGAGGIVGGITGLVDNITNVIAANKEQYMTFHTANNDSNAIINAYYGLCGLYGINTINDNEVESAINEVGYDVDYFTDNLDIAPVSADFITVKFAFVKIVGQSTEICNIIAEILMNGVKIWYSVQGFVPPEIE